MTRSASPREASLTGPGQARAHVRELLAGGGTCRSIAGAAGLAPMTVHAVATGHRRHHQETIAALLAVAPGQLDRPRTDAGGTRLRLRALHVMGHGSARIARAAGVSPPVIRAILRGRSTTVSTRLRDAVAAVYDAWWDKQPPQHTRALKTAATAARRRAITGNWAPPLALDDDQLDTPGYRPAAGWKPARGTGTAPDFRYKPPAARKEDNKPMNHHHAPHAAGSRPAAGYPRVATVLAGQPGSGRRAAR